MRIISGTLKSREFKAPKSVARPTTDRVRESLFSILDSLDVIEDANVLDAFSGSGALCFESLSRGAYSAMSVDISLDAVKTITTNAKSLFGPEYAEKITIRKGNILNDIPVNNELYSLVFIDPPYNFSDEDILSILNKLKDLKLLKTDAIIVIESAKLRDLSDISGFETVQNKEYGNTVLQILNYTN